MKIKTIKSFLLIVTISFVTSIATTSVFLYLNSHKAVQPTTQTKDTKFTKYETLINGFLAVIRKGDIDSAYKETSPSFQKLTTLDNFKKLISAWQSTNSLPSNICTVTQYSEPFSTAISGLPDVYIIVQTKCETTENNEVKGLNVEFIEDNGTPKISYINVYKNPIIHQK